MRILLDHCIDWRLKRFMGMHDVKSAHEMGWDALKNGNLLTAAASQFDAILTVDQNIKHEQNLNRLPIAVVVLVAASNRTSDLKKLLPAVEGVLSSLKSCAMIEIDASQTVRIISPGKA